MTDKEPSEATSPPDSNDVEDAPTGETKQRVNIFIAVFLFVQLALPASYYLVNDNPADERYAWRMFSSQRVVQCRTRWTEGPARQVFSPTAEIHVVWNTLITRQRTDVINAYAAKRCKAQSSAGEPEVYLTMTCQKPGDLQYSVVHDGNQNLCKEAL